MFTTCNECGTVFRISPAELRVAEGQVRCGHCSATFNALATLTDEPPPTTVLPQLQIPPDLEPEIEAAPELQPEPDSSTRDSVTGDETLEFNVPEDNWSEFFVEVSEPEALSPMAVPPEPEQETDTDTDTEHEPETEPAAAPGIEPEPEPAPINHVPDDWQELLSEVTEDVDEAPVYRIDTDNADAAPKTGLALVSVSPDEAWDRGESGGENEVRADFPTALTGNAQPPAEPVLIASPFEWRPVMEPPAKSPRRRRVFTAGAVLLALTLLLQTIHYQRDDLAARPTLYRPLTRLYSALNLSLLPNWNLHAYEVRGSEAVAGATASGALDVLARIAIVGSEPVGLPMVRVTLRDRFSKTLGSRAFSPDEYLDAASPPGELLAPGTLIPVKISLRDPGTDAFGYEVDVCVLYRREGLVCQQERDQKAPFTR